MSHDAQQLSAYPSPIPPLLGLGTILGLLLLAFAAWQFSSGGWLSFLLFFLILSLLLLATQCLLDLLRRRFTLFSLTPRDLILQRGVLRRYNKTLVLARVQDVTVEQGILARLFDYGSLRVESAGERGMLTLEDVPQPYRWSEAILRMAEARQHEGAHRRNVYADADNS